MEESAGTPGDMRFYTTPFILNTEDGKYLVLKAVKLCNLRTIDCMKQEASCVLKVDKPPSPCPMSSPESTTKCYQRPAPQLRFMNTGALSNLFANTTERASRVINQ
ncbi:ORF-61 [Teiidae poxvirus 1]|nr:ORF-61 [Teiidae poxvirus 1]